MLVLDVLLALNLLVVAATVVTRRRPAPARVEAAPALDAVVVPMHRPDTAAIEAAKALHPAYRDRLG